MDVVVWGKQGEVVSQYLSKGRQALVEGRLRERKWEGQDGQQKRRMEVVADSVRFLGKRGRQQPRRGLGAVSPAPGRNNRYRTVLI